MMRYWEILNEALPISIGKKYSKGWDSSRYNEIFEKTAQMYPELNSGNVKLYRVYIPFINTAKPQAPHQLVSYVNDKGYEMVDYNKGLVSKCGNKNLIRIGKILDDPDIKKIYDQDPARASQNSMVVCISRHPYDIAGMSTNRGWTSCMNIDNGVQSQYVINDIEEGSIIAYLTNSHDNNITNPVARIMIKPFFNDDGDMILGNEDKIYGTPKPGFKETVEKWLSDIEGVHKFGTFRLNKKLYSDGKNSFVKYDNSFNNTFSTKRLMSMFSKTKDDKILDEIINRSSIDDLIEFIKFPVLGQSPEQTKRMEYKVFHNLSTQQLFLMVENDSWSGAFTELVKRGIREFPCSIDFGSCKDINLLPSNIIINGDFLLNHSSIKVLPNNLTVNGVLDIRNTAVKSLPETLKANNVLKDF